MGKLLRHKVLLIISVMAIAVGTTACRESDEPMAPSPAERCEQTLIMYLPWSTDLLNYFTINIQDLLSSINERRLRDERVFICLATDNRTVELMRVDWDGKQYAPKKLKEYNNFQFSSAEDIGALMREIKGMSPSDVYSLIIGSHGMGWIPVQRSKSAKSTQEDYERYYKPETSLTRYFGGLSPEYQVDTQTFIEALNIADLHFNYILFDDCYMSSVEMAYDLRGVTDYLIASPNEIMKAGFPYSKCGRYLLGEPDYAGVVDEYIKFYRSYQSPYGTVAVTDCRELDNLALVIKQIYTTQPIDDSKTSTYDVQVMDAYNPTIFYDLGDYVVRNCPDQTLVEEFIAQLEKTVPFKEYTPRFYASGTIKQINAFSGLTTSAPSWNRLAAAKTETAWYKATHP